MGSLFIRTIRKTALIALFIGCSRMEQSEREKIRKRNCKGESIYRNQGDLFYPISPPTTSTPTPPKRTASPSTTSEPKSIFTCKGWKSAPKKSSASSCSIFKKPPPTEAIKKIKSLSDLTKRSSQFNPG